MSGSRKKSTKRRIVRIVVIVDIILAILVAIVLYLKSRVAEEYGSGSETEIQTATVSEGSISTTVSGTGNLTDEDVETIEIVNTVEIEEICVSAGDVVAEGDLLAKVDMSTVVAAMSTLQQELDTLDSQIDEAEDDAVDSHITTTVAGRVKAIYGQEGDDVATVMYENGALAILSLDGYMAVDVETQMLAQGDTVTVESSDGTQYEGSVASVESGTATVLVTDNGTVYGDTVSIYDDEGELVGSGELSIHEPLNITGYAGTISGVSVSENSKVSSGKRLFSLTDTEYSGNYNSLLSERKEVEDNLQQLLTIYKEGAVYATAAGTVSSVGEQESTSSSAEASSNALNTGESQTEAATQEESDLQTLLSICTGDTMTVSVNVDESSILSLEVGQEATIAVDALGDEEYSGTVTEIQTTAGSSSGGVTSYAAVITLEKAEQMLSGMSASVAIRIQGVEDALLIPSDALMQTSSSSYVYTSYDEETGELGGMVEVTAGLDNGTYVEITSGLSEGDTIYYADSSEERGMGFGGGNMPGGGNFDIGDMPGGGDFGGGNMPGGGEMPGGMSRGN